MKLDMAGTGAQRKKPFALLREICAEGDWKCLLSAFIWGAGCFCYRQWIKGAIYLLLEAAFILFFVFFGGEALVGFFTLGVQEANPWFGIEGDNSITMLIWGIFAIIMIVVAVMVGGTHPGVSAGHKRRPRVHNLVHPLCRHSSAVCLP